MQRGPRAARLASFKRDGKRAANKLPATAVQLVQVRPTFPFAVIRSRVRLLGLGCASATAVRKLSMCLSRSEAYLLHIAVRRCFKGSSKARSDSLFDAACFSAGGIISLGSAANVAKPWCPEKAAETRGVDVLTGL